MENKDFLPRTTPRGEEELRDMPPADRAPMYRMELQNENQSLSNGMCGCGSEHSADNGGCVGYEGCGENSWGLCNHPLAMVYSPCQLFRALYDPATALDRGTLFTELDLPLGGAEGAFTTIGCACRSERRRV